MPVPAPVSAYSPEMAVTKMNKKTDRAKEITRCKDRDVGLLSWDSDTAGEPSTALAVTLGGLWGHPSHSWVTDNISGKIYHQQVALCRSLPKLGSSGGAEKLTQEVTNSWLGTGMWCGIIFLLVVSPSFRDLQSIKLHEMLATTLQRI